MQKKLLVLIGILLPLGLIVWSLLVPEEPRYTPLPKQGGVVLREYAPFMVAETAVTAPFEGIREAAFPALVDYVTGRNAAGRKVPMRAPVRSQAIAEPDHWRVQFVMPWEYPASMLPPPGNPAVTLKPVYKQVVAVRRYGGGWGEARYRKQEAALRKAVAEAGLEAVGTPIFARYNAPFVPGFLRRNEVQIEVRDPRSADRATPPGP